MSTQQQQPVVLPDYATASDTLWKTAYAEVFFTKCAALGMAPQTEQEAASMMEMAQKLRIYKEATAVKKASVGYSSPVLAMSADLDRALAQQGFSVPNQADELRIKAASQYLAQDPTIYNAILGVIQAEAKAAQAA